MARGPHPARQGQFFSLKLAFLTEIWPASTYKAVMWQRRKIVTHPCSRYKRGNINWALKQMNPAHWKVLFVRLNILFCHIIKFVGIRKMLCARSYILISKLNYLGWQIKLIYPYKYFLFQYIVYGKLSSIVLFFFYFGVKIYFHFEINWLIQNWNELLKVHLVHQDNFYEDKFKKQRCPTLSPFATCGDKLNFLNFIF